MIFRKKEHPSDGVLFFPGDGQRIEEGIPEKKSPPRLGMEGGNEKDIYLFSVLGHSQGIGVLKQSEKGNDPTQRIRLRGKPFLPFFQPDLPEII